MLKEMLDMLNDYKSNEYVIESDRLNIEILIRKKAKEEQEIYEPSCCSNMSDMPNGNTISNSTYKSLEKKEDKLEAIDKMINDRRENIRLLECKNKKIDALIRTLKEKDQIFIKKIIIDKKQLTDIMYELKYSDYKSVQRSHSRIMNELEKEFKKGI